MYQKYNFWKIQFSSFYTQVKNIFNEILVEYFFFYALLESDFSRIFLLKF